ncbi:hypothetical protein [Leucobacter sp. OH1287]|uniref:hypothetical protein n=1 Tax=Leucobacter sp. OH1287 TaxID=2491049 RepID=UPI000F5D59E3|nr:hypothetical protein [Leucobacter sp. OH1287]RRD59966.1 hypothetical protein EII30_07505 [Leucobacter sp. OH1287]
MSYLTCYYLSEAARLRARLTACAASVGIPDPESWVYVHRWKFAAMPGWAEKYDQDWAAHDGDPDYDPTVAISDDDILAAVTQVRGSDESAG